MAQLPFLKKLPLIFGNLLCLAVLLGACLIQAAQAQSDSGPSDWGPPTNLSNSGAAGEPRLAVDAAGRANVLWQDAIAGVAAVQGVDGNWTLPAFNTPPFEKHLARLKLAAGPDGLIHAAWTSEKGTLFYSQIRSEGFASPGVWSTPQTLASAVIDFDLDAAGTRTANLAYIRTEDTPEAPAGVYALRMLGGGSTNTRLLYASPYFRSLTGEQAQVSIAAGEAGQVYVAWDEQPQEKVALAISTDEGKTWSEPRLVDGRQPGDGSVTGPSLPLVEALGNQVVLVWQAGHQGNNCAQYSQFSSDGGLGWSEAVTLPGQLGQTCAGSLQFLDNASGGGALDTAYLLADSAAGVQLFAWQNGASEAGGWSDPQTQSALSSFSNPATYRATSLGCLQGGLDGGDLLVAGCERAGAPGGGDIWLFGRSLGDPAGWFPAPAAEPVWDEPVEVDRDALGLETPRLIADRSGRLHAFWTRADDSRIFYALWDGTRWTTPQAVLESPGRQPLALTVGYRPATNTADGATQAETLFVAWQDAQTKSLYASQAPAAEALNAARWEAPQALPTSGVPADPHALVKEDGRVEVAYAVPFNEGRGIYVLESENALQPDGRLEWQAAQTVFDAAAAGWDSLGGPHLAAAEDGSLLALWQRRGLPPADQATGLYAARRAASDNDRAGTGESTSAGAGVNAGAGNWSAAEAVSEATILWSEMLARPNGELHRAWQQVLGGQPALFHQVSGDGGQSWSEADRLVDAEGLAGVVDLAIDGGGRLNLVEIAAGGASNAAAEGPNLALKHWLWEGDGWQAQESVGLAAIAAAQALSAAGPAEALAALYSGVEKPPESSDGATAVGAADAPESVLSFTARQLDLPDPGQNDPATATPAATPSAAPRATTPPTAAVTATPAFSKDASAAGGVFGGQFGLLAIGAIPAAVLIVGAFYLAMRRARRGQ